jgi:hypothetical protein
MLVDSSVTRFKVLDVLNYKLTAVSILVKALLSSFVDIVKANRG